MAAVAQAAVNGTERASHDTGIPESTIRYWLDKPEFAELREKTRDEMRDGFTVLVHKAQEALMARIDQMEPRDLTILLGVATDKSLLLSGDATSRSETRSLSDELDDHERAALRQFLVDELERRRNPTGDPGAGLDAVAAPVPADGDVGHLDPASGSGIGQD